MPRPTKLIVSLIIIAAFYPSDTTSLRILGYFPLPVYSHQVPFFHLFDHLISRGHNVTMVAGFQLPSSNISQYKYIKVPQVFKGYANNLNPLGLRWVSFNGCLIKARVMSDFCLRTSAKILANPITSQFLAEDTSSYDLIISDLTFCAESSAMLLHRYPGTPLINFHPLGYRPATFALFGSLALPSMVPDTRLGFTEQMSMTEFVCNVLTTGLDLWEFNSYYLPRVEEQMKTVSYPGSDSRPPLRDLLGNISFTFVEYDPAVLGIPFPLSPNVAFTGGMQLRASAPLPTKLARFMAQQGSRGVVLVALGSILNFSNFERRVVDAFIQALSRLTYAVVWKVDVPVEMPDHVLTGTWFPQQDILGHPNCKAFVTHGGIHSTMEAAYHGVPVVTMPGFADQFQNCKLMEERGMGVQLFHETVTGDSLYLALMEVINNPKYKAAVSRISHHARSPPFNNIDRAVHWAEYVATNPGVAALRPRASEYGLLTLLSLDVILGLVGVFVLLLIILVLLIWCMVRCCCTKKKQQ